MPVLTIPSATRARPKRADWFGPGAAGLVLLVIVFVCWLAMSRGEDQRYSESGFDLRGSASIAARAAGRTLAPAAPQAGSLTLPRPIEIGAAPPPRAAEPEAADEPKGPPKIAEAGADDKTPEASPQEAGAAGLPVTAGGLKAAGAQVGLFDRMVIRVAGHPKIVKYILNNKLFNAALYANPWTSKACNDKAFLQSYLANGSDPNGVSREVNVLQAVLGNPESARAAANTEFINRLVTCPATKAVAADPKAVVAIAQGSPQMLPLTMNPMLLEALGSNPLAQDSMLSIQNALSQGPAPAASASVSRR